MSPKHKRFVAEYLVDQNAKQAAIRSGYSKKAAETNGPRLLRNAQVKAAIEAKLAKIEEKSCLTKEYWQRAVKDVIERCMQREAVMEFDYLEKELKQVQVMDTTTGKMVGLWEFDSAGANAALRMAGQHLGLLAEKHIHDLGKETLEHLIAGSQEAA